MTQEQIIAENAKTAGDHDWVKEQQLTGLRVDEFFARSRLATRPRSKRDGEDHPLDDVLQNNAEAADSQIHRYDEQNN